MTTLDPLCFIVMPFRPEFNYFYLYLQKHLKENHQLRVERGDHRILTKPLIEKVRDQIRSAHVLIADITGANPNVLYEVGLAHAYGKPVVFLTQDPPEQAPVDLRQFEFIAYDLGRHTDCLEKLDNAMRSLFADQYADLFELACKLLVEFNKNTRLNYSATSEAEFKNRVARGARTEGLPDGKDELDMAEFLLPKIVQDSTDIRIMKRLTEWFGERFDPTTATSARKGAR
jgi:hypothetical protein